MLFKESFDLYEVIFKRFDSSSDRRFSREEFLRLLVNGLQLDRNTAVHDTEQFFKEFEPTKSPGYIKYLEIEADYRDYIDSLRIINRLPTLVSLPTILKMLQTHLMQTGKTLRQLFNKTKAMSGDGMNQYEFQKVIENIAA